METIAIKEIQHVLPWFLKHEKVWSEYDAEADTLYLHFKKPNHTDQTEMTDDEIIVRYEQGKIIGLTILNAGKRNLKMR